MPSRRRNKNLAAAVAVAVMLALVALGSLSACTTSSGGDQKSEAMATPQAPPPPKQSTPEAAVRSYTEWISYAYNILDSEVATQTMTPEEGVRVDSYIEFNRQQGRAIEQKLTSFEVKGTKKLPSAGKKGASAKVVTFERWRYRYIDTKTRTYVSPLYTASYDATYTVALDPKGGLWRVDRVDVESRGPVK